MKLVSLGHLAASLAGALFGVIAIPAWALTPAELQQLMQKASKPPVEFQEVRESPWLSAPVTSRGTFRSTPEALEKRVETPRKEVWRLLADRIEWQGADGTIRQIRFADAPAAAALSNVMRRVVAGDIVALQRDFDVQVSGDDRVWRAVLRPTNPSVARQLEQVELQGGGSMLQVIIVLERQGERTTTRLKS